MPRYAASCALAQAGVVRWPQAQGRYAVPSSPAAMAAGAAVGRIHMHLSVAWTQAEHLTHLVAGSRGFSYHSCPVPAWRAISSFTEQVKALLAWPGHHQAWPRPLRQEVVWVLFAHLDG